MVNDKMIVSAGKTGDLLVRVAADRHETLLGEPGAAQAQMGAGREMGAGWITVTPETVADDGRLTFWIDVAMTNETKSRFWANDQTTTMQFNSDNQIWISSDGMHVNGTKRFIMRVPTLTARNDGLWLIHAATESPYDGIEYWENLTLDSSGHARWVLPDYVPRIASSKAPWVVFASDGARAVLDRSNPEEWHVDVTGAPSSTVAVLVKGARMIDADVDDSGEPVMRDYARESPWHPGVPSNPGAGGDGGGGPLPDDVLAGGGMYEPAPDPNPEGDNQ